MNVARGAGAVALAVLACGRGDACGPVSASGDGFEVTVTPEGGCGGRTWRADVSFADGRTQALAGDRAGEIRAVMIGDFSGDSMPDLVITVAPGRVFGFRRQGGIFFGRELPPPPGQGSLVLRAGRLESGGAQWDPVAGIWVPARR